MFPGALISLAVELTGAGATFPYPFYSKAFSEFYRETGIKVNYQAIGSGGGIRQLLARSVDFGATDAFMTDEELKKAGGEILHFPTVLGAVVVVYNLPVKGEIKLTGDLIAKIFMGKIKRWNDPALVALNPQLKNLSIPIIVVHRSDGSGTTFIFSDYLSKVSPEWKKKIGAGKALRWLTGIGAKGNPGVAGYVKRMKGAIGYVELAYALQNRMKYALIKNRAGRFVRPEIKSITAAANIKVPYDTRVSITDTPSPDGYPISSFTWIIVYRDLKYGKMDLEKAKALKKMLKFLFTKAQKWAPSLDYAPLPSSVVKLNLKKLDALTYGGKPLD